MEPMSLKTSMELQRDDIFLNHFRFINSGHFFRPIKLHDATDYIDACIFPSTIKQLCRNHIEFDTRPDVFEKFTSEFTSFGLAEKNNVYTLYTFAIAAERGNLPLINWLIRKVGKDMLNMGDAKGRTPLYMACKSYVTDKYSSSHTLNGILHLLKHGSNPNVLCDKRITPLNVAMRLKYISAVATYLIKHDALGVKR